MKYLTLIVLLLFCACTVPMSKRGKAVVEENEDEDKTPVNVSLFSKWHQDNADFIMDFSGGNCSKPFPFHFITPSSAVCTCQLDCTTGTSDKGKAIMSACTYQKGSSEPDADPGCSSLNAKYKYTNKGGKLSFTNLDADVTTTFSSAASSSSTKNDDDAEEEK